MSRYAARDEQGRPIVAELGRAETPQETADRKAEARRERRDNQTPFNFVVAVVASLLVMGLIVLIVVRPDPGRGGTTVTNPVDYAAIAGDAEGAVDVSLVVPALPETWQANRAELSTADGVTTWEIGFVTPEGDYAEMTQAIDANPTWLAARLDGTPLDGTVMIDGVNWDRYDRRDDDDAGNLELALVREGADSTLVVSGTASDLELETLAASAGME